MLKTHASIGLRLKLIQLTCNNTLPNTKQIEIIVIIAINQTQSLFFLPQAQKPFQFINIGVLRQYLYFEFEPLRHKLPFPYDLERCIDDFVFFCFFVGNDFLPHLPSLSIRDGSIDMVRTLIWY
jgi:5'-3' exonuclease